MLSYLGRIRVSGCISGVTGTCRQSLGLCRPTSKVLKENPYTAYCYFSRLAYQRIETNSSANIFSFHYPVKCYYRSTIRRTKNGEQKEEKMEEKTENIDDLKFILQNKSMSLTAKFKILFKQYGVVLVVVHCITAAFWMSLFYFAVSRGLDIVPYMEKYGVFDLLVKIGLPASEHLKSPGASNLLAAYLLYEVAKPIRYPVTIVGTIYAVKFLRRLGRLKQIPKTDATIGQLMHTQGKIVRHHVNNTAIKYRERYSSGLRRNGYGKKNNGLLQKKNGKQNGFNGRSAR